MRLLARELRFALRLLLRDPGFASVAVAALGLAIGACAIIYSVVDAVALRPLPYPRPEEIVRLSQIDEAGQRGPFSDLNFDDLRASAASFSAMAEFSPGTTSVVAGSEPLRVGASTVSETFFEVLGTSPSRGRRFVADELHEGGPRAAIVSARFWREHFGGLTNLSDARLRVNGDLHAIVGVMPAGFDFPAGIDIWTPREARPRNPFRKGQNWPVVARIRPGVSLSTARADATAVARRLKQQYGSDTAMADVSTIPLQEVITGSVRPILFVLLTAVVFLLLVACANLANMLLARTSVRRRELAVRAALGASGVSLVLPLVAESLIIAVSGGVIGIALAYTGVRVLAATQLDMLPRAGEIGVSWRVLAFTIGVTWFTALILSLVAGWQAHRPNPADWLKNSQRGQTTGSLAALRSGLVVAQLIVSVVLLIGAGLLGRSLTSLLRQDLGFRREQILTIDLSTPGPRVRPTPAALEFDDPSSLPRQARLNQRLLERLRTMPGVVESGGVSLFPPLGGRGGSSGTFIIARGTDRFRTMQDLLPLFNVSERTGYADFRVASAGYFRAMGIPLVRGRLFDDRDGTDAPQVALISESLARTRWPGRDPIGEQIEYGGMDGDLRLLTIIGIVGDVRERGLDSQPQPTFYAEYRQRPLGTFDFSLVLQTTVDPSMVAADARQIIQEIAPDVPPRFRTVNDVVAQSVATRRVTFVLTTAFAGAAMLVAVLGIYGVLSYLVAQRRREFGVRLALGARQSDVQRLVLGEAARLLVIGLALGVSLALAMTRVLNGMLFGVTATDPATYIGVVSLLGIAALTACEVPALRATRVDPAQTLRSE